MPSLRELVPLSRAELDDIARERKLRGFSTLSKEDLMITLADERVSGDAESLLKMASSELYDLAKKENVPNPSKLKKDELILALLPENSTAAAPAKDAPVVVRVYWPRGYEWITDEDGQRVVRFKGEVVGYCTPGQRAAVYTYLRSAALAMEKEDPTIEEVLAQIAKQEFVPPSIRAVMEEPPKGAKVKDPPL